MLTKVTRNRGTAAIALALIAGCALQEAEPTDARVATANSPDPVAAAAPAVITDANGRLRCLVMLRDAAAAAMPRQALTDRRFDDYHPGQAVRLVQAIERDHDLTALAMTSQIGVTLVAYLRADQIAALVQDPRVASVTPSHWVEESSDAGSLWLDQHNPPSELESWGTQAINPGGGGGDPVATKGGLPSIRVYVLDGGVALHDDLNVVRRVNALYPMDLVAAARVPCYPHATHVAGIIGARGDGRGSRGVAAGVELVSVSLLDPTDLGPGGCMVGGIVDDAIVFGLEWIARDVLRRGRVGVVNLSFNGPSFGPSAPATGTMRTVATPTKDYPGVFITQSAGNHFTDACAVAFPDASPGDGVMVVGMINDHGQAVRPLSGVFGSRNELPAGSEEGSNYGRCVEAWAPGRSIYSTWDGPYKLLSGTSMAAPHVAGLAAVLAGSINDSIELEAAVRARMVPLGSVDASGAAIAIPTLAPLVPVGAPHDTPYAEVVATHLLSNTSNPDQPLTTYDTEPFTLAFDSVGSRGYTCDLSRRVAGGPPIVLLNGLRGRFDNQSWSPGVWTVSSTLCPSAHTIVTSRPAPRARWMLDGVEIVAPQVTLRADTTAVLSYDSANAATCDVDVKVAQGFNLMSIAGYPQANHGTSDPAVPIARTPGTYQYVLICRDPYGGDVQPRFEVEMQPAAAAQINDAAFVSQSLPSTVEAGTAFTASVTMRNTGTTTWTSSAWYLLGAQNPLDNTTWGTGRVELDPWDSIAPNQSKTFTYTFHAPTTPGTYHFQWRMVRETIAWFGAWSENRDIVVTAATPTCGANPACTPGQTRTSACGNCGSSVDTCSPTCQWSLGVCAGEGVCAPGDTEDCCPCGSANNCGCEGSAKCSDQCTWNACADYACKPNTCQ